MVARWLGKLLRPVVDARPDRARLLGARAGGGGGVGWKKHSSSARHRRVGPSCQRVSAVARGVCDVADLNGPTCRHQVFRVGPRGDNKIGRECSRRPNYLFLSLFLYFCFSFSFILFSFLFLNSNLNSNLCYEFVL
jgi:hypothetical protein